MNDSRVPLKNPLLAVCLGLLFPGAGHLYQGRTFKGVLYAVCIASTFTYGMFLSDWTALYAGSPLSAKGRVWGYLAQAPLGAPTIVFPVIQYRRYHAPSNGYQIDLDEPLKAPFRGVVRMGDSDTPPGMQLSELSKFLKATEKAALEKAVQEGRAENVQLDVNADNPPEFQYYELAGEIELNAKSTYLGPVVEGRFRGHLMLWNSTTEAFEKTEEPIEFPLSSEVGRFEIDPEVYADRERSLKIPVVGKGEDGRLTNLGVLRGTIPRPITDWLNVPLEPEKLNRLHFELGKTFDLALVYTWIAGLLNVLVLWDAYEGPAYGYGDETPEGEGDKPGSDPNKPAKPNTDAAT